MGDAADPYVRGPTVAAVVIGAAGKQQPVGAGGLLGLRAGSKADTSTPANTG
ncbi:MAG: hypothetical protein SOV74_05485 [Coriobacteriales bacterium]|nr:hypothetical protein [Coriobacteriales bacterium]